MSNAITAFQPRLAPIDLTSVVETAEALHTQREHARCLVQDKHANNLFVAKGNQPALAEALQWLDPGSVSLPGSAGGEGARPDRDAHSPGQHRAH
ncbi:MAG TPA: hypothetical protein VMW47_09105 [Verrucomicrobiae bacterium]|nr:hypothetical protein [Verrucomicrobiae bacterium]